MRQPRVHLLCVDWICITDELLSLDVSRDTNPPKQQQSVFKGGGGGLLSVSLVILELIL